MKNFNIRVKSFSNKKRNIIKAEKFNTDNVLAFKNIFEEISPIKLNKKDLSKSDQNLTCFIDISSILNKTKAISLAKTFLENFLLLINNPNAITDNLFQKNIEENFYHRLSMSIDNIYKYNNDKDSNIKYKVQFQIDNKLTDTLRKINFNVNLYNIHNYMSTGVELDRRNKPKLRNISYMSDILIDNPNPDEKNKSIKSDIITLNPHGLAEQQNNNSENPVNMISFFEFSLIPEKKNLKLNLEIFDEINEKTFNFQYDLFSIDFIVECVVLKMNYSDFLKLEFQKTNNENNENLIEIEEKDQPNISKFLKLKDYSQINKYLHYDLKIIDVDYFMNGNKFI